MSFGGIKSSSVTKNHHFKFTQKWLTFSLRIVLAIGISTVISEPILIKIFESEIKEQIALDNNQALNQFAEKIDAKYEKKLADLNKKIEEFKQKITQNQLILEDKQRKVYKMMETNGKGYGALTEYASKDFKNTQEEITVENQRIEAQIKETKKEIDKINEEKTRELQSHNSLIKNKDGFVTQYEALETLSKRKPSVGAIKTAIGLLFIIVETMPIMIKLTSTKGLYEKINQEQHKFVLSLNNKKIKYRKNLQENWIDLNEEQKIILLEKVNNQIHTLSEKAATTENIEESEKIIWQVKKLEKIWESYFHELNQKENNSSEKLNQNYSREKFSDDYAPKTS